MQSLKVVLGLAAAWSVAMGCAPDAAEREACELGTEGCGCRDDGECDPELMCVELRKGDGDRCDPITGAIDGAGGAAGGTGRHSSGPDAGAGSGGSSTGGHSAAASGGAATDQDAGSSGATTGAGGSSAGSGGVATGSGGASSGSGGSHQNASGGASSASGGRTASGGAAAAGGAAGAAGAAGSSSSRPGLSDACISCAMGACASIAKDCKSDAICNGCIAGMGKGGDCALGDSLFGGLFMCVCGVEACTEQCGSSCIRR